MRISSFLPFLPLSVVAQITLPENALEGIAIHLQDDSGNITYVHQSNFAQYGISLVYSDSGVNGTNSTSLEARGSLPNGDAIVCDSQRTLFIQHLHDNLIDMIDFLGCGYTIVTDTNSKYKYVAVSATLGSSLIYICNYSAEYREFQGWQLWEFVLKVFDLCGSRAIAGWYSQGLYNVAYGYTSSSYSFCGPLNN